MPQIPNRARRRAIITAVLAAAVTLAVTSVARAQEVVAVVDGEPITKLDIDHRSKFIEMSTHKPPTRKEVIDGLIDEILEVREAKKYSVDPAASDVNDAYSNVAKNMNIDSQKLTDILDKGGASADTLKHRLRAQMAWSSLVRGRFKASLEIADSDVEAALQLHSPEDKSEVAYDYVLRPVLLVVPRGSPDAAYDARKRDADALRARFLTCAEGIPFARALKEVAVRDQVVKNSTDLVPQLRDILDKTDLGHLTPPEQTAEGIQMFAVCSKTETKNDTPGKKAIRDQMFEKKFGAKAQRYLAELRRAAMIEYKVPEDK
jgi:peptidyl-prolyl cis-trans isomerase SurA